MDGEEEEGWHIFSYFMHLPMIGSFAHSFFITPQKNLWNMSCIPYLVIWRKSVVVRKVRSKKLSCLLKFLQWWGCRAKSWSQDSKAVSYCLSWTQQDMIPKLLNVFCIGTFLDEICSTTIPSRGPGQKSQRFFVTPWALQSLEFSRLEYWSG